MLVGYTDWFLAGRYLKEDSYLAAMGLMVYMLWVLPTLFAAIAIGATAVIARRTGEGNSEKVEKTFNQAILLGFIATFLVTAVFVATLNHIAGWMQLDGKAAALATQYLGVILFVVPMIMLEQVIAASLRGSGDTMTGFIAKSLVVVVNLIVSSALVTGWGPFPNLGWIGLAIGTACGHVLSGTLLLAVVLKGRGAIRLRFNRLMPDRATIRDLLRIGLPGGVDSLILLGCHLVFLGIVNRLGDRAAAAHGIGIQVEALGYMSGGAFQVAAATMVGQFIGAKLIDRARAALWTCIASGVLIMTIAGLVFFAFGQDIAGVFQGSRNEPTAILAGSLLKIVAFAQPFLAIVMIGLGGLRGAGDTRIVMIIQLVGMLFVRLFVAWYLTGNSLDFGWFLFQGPEWGIYGAWIAMIADLIVRATLILWRIAHGGWQRIKLSEVPAAEPITLDG